MARKPKVKVAGNAAEPVVKPTRIRKPKAAVAKVATPEVAPKPNLEFVGKHPVKKFKTESGETIKLPEDQSKPFYHEKAVLIAQRLPNYYKTYDCCNCGK